MLTNSRMLISNTILGFESPSHWKYTIRAILVPNLKIFSLDKILYLLKFEGADVKYHNNVAFPSSSLRISKQNSFGSTFKKVFLSRNNTFSQIEGAKVKHDNFVSSSILKIAK